MAKPRSKEERLFAAAVLRRSFELRGEEYADGYQFVYQGVLRDLGVEDADVQAYLEKHLEAVEAAIGRKG